MILTKRPLAVVFLTMAAVIILYRLYTGMSDDYIAVDPSFHATGAVESVEGSGGKYTVTLGDVEVVRGTCAEPGKKLLLYVKSDNQKISNISSHGQQAGQLNPYNYSEALKESNDKSDNIQNNESGLKIGNVIEVTGTAEAFEKAGNPGQFDAYSYYLGKGYAYKVFVESCLVIDAGVSYREYLRNMGDYCTAIFERYLPENEAGILSAMMFGRRSLLSEDDRELYKKNGLMHILAVSGVKTLSLEYIT